VVENVIEAASFEELIVGSYVFFVLLTLFALLLGFCLERLSWAQKRRIFDVQLKRGQLRKEALGTALFVMIWSPAFAGALAIPLLRFGHGWLAELLGFLVPITSFQVLYWGMHRAMHSRPLFWLHRWHHESLVTTPMTGLSMHPLEAVGWTIAMLGPAIVLGRFGLLGLYGFATYLAFHWIGNIVGHANAELSPLRSTRASSLSANPVIYHSLHHARFDGHYGFAAAWMDRLCRTEFPDWLELHERVMSGHPLPAISTRGEANTVFRSKLDGAGLGAHDRAP
jgi:sterol desaturase/sphingolipid hydroxylase (fatty acid hydroxylase superfamily)